MLVNLVPTVMSVRNFMGFWATNQQLAQYKQIKIIEKVLKQAKKMCVWLLEPEEPLKLSEYMYATTEFEKCSCNQPTTSFMEVHMVHPLMSRVLQSQKHDIRLMFIFYFLKFDEFLLIISNVFEKKQDVT